MRNRDTINRIIESIDYDRLNGSEQSIVEEYEVSDILRVTSNISIDGYEVIEGDYISITSIDEDSEIVTIDIYDSEGVLKESDIKVSFDELDLIEDSIEDIEIDEGIKKFIRNGKVVIKTAKDLALKARAKGKNFFYRNGQKIYTTYQQRRQWARNARKNFRGRVQKKAQRMRDKARRLFGRNRARESFTIPTNSMTITVQEGDILCTVEDGTLSIIRDNLFVVEGIVVSEDFLNSYVSDGILEELSVGD